MSLEGLKKAAQTILLLAAIAGLWGFQTYPDGRFQYHAYALTVYRGIPFPAVDLVVGADGSFRVRQGKAHRIGLKEIEALIGKDPKAWPQTVVLGVGTREQVEVDPLAFGQPSWPSIEALPSGQAVQRYNELKGMGLKVAAIIHSTC